MRLIYLFVAGLTKEHITLELTRHPTIAFKQTEAKEQ
jgi:hypothetical protein